MLSESANVAAVSPEALTNLISAKSLPASPAITFAVMGAVVPFKRTRTLVAPSTTWLLVRISPSLDTMMPVPTDSPEPERLSMVTMLGAIAAAARAMSVLPMFSGLMGAAVTRGPPLDELSDELAPMSPPTTPPPSDIARTSRSATTRLPRGRAVGAAGGVLAQWESKLMS